MPPPPALLLLPGAAAGSAAGLLGRAPGAASRLPPQALAALVPLLVLIVALDAYCLIDLARARTVRNAPKIIWVIVILFFSAPVGALAYLFFGRERGGAGRDRQAVPGPQQESGTPQAADDARRVPLRGRPRVGGGAGAGGEGGQPIVTTAGLTRDYGGAGLFGVDLLVPRGSVYGLVGLNGAGKTTLLSLLSGTRHADHGTIGMHVARHRVAVCPDVCEFDGWLTAYEVVDLARSLVWPTADGETVAAALKTAGLADSAGRRAGGFSRGMLQRLGLACALVGDPELLILDEPTSALDPAGRAEMLGLVAAMRGSRTVIFSSHILGDVQRIADQVGILRDGRLLYQGATQDLIDTYLKPSWLVRIAGDIAPVAAAMAGETWATGIEPAGSGTIRVDATSIEAGERGIPAVIAACGARQVSCEPAAADLETAFLALTGARSGE